MNETSLIDNREQTASLCSCAGETAPSTLTRREVLKTAATVAGIAAALPLLSSSARADDTWVSAGKAADFTKNSPQKVTLTTGEVLYITRTGDKDLTAVSAKCTHKGCELGWVASDNHLECPCHGAVFQADGTNVNGTRRHPENHLPNLQSVPVRQRDTIVEVKLAGIDDATLKPERG